MGGGGLIEVWHIVLIIQHVFDKETSTFALRLFPSFFFFVVS